MTSPAAAPPRRPTREQLVAAVLVGTVVVLLGFASGLGLGPATITAAQSGPTRGPGSTGAAPGGTPAAPATTAPSPVAYVVAPAPAASPVEAAPPSSSSRPAPSSTPAADPSAHPSPPVTSPAVPGPPPACSPSLVAALLQLLLPSAGLPGGGALGLGGLLTMLSHLEQTAETLLAAPAGRLLEQVTSLLGRPGVMSPGEAPPGVAPEALAQSCATGVGRALQLVATGQGVGSAARAAGR